VVPALIADPTGEVSGDHLKSLDTRKSLVIIPFPQISRLQRTDKIAAVRAGLKRNDDAQPRMIGVITNCSACTTRRQSRFTRQVVQHH
jgi:hypothetical protein